MHRTLPEKLISSAVRHARAVVLMTFAVTIVLAWFALRVRINPDFFPSCPRTRP
jgi:hypothetical protein